MVCQHRIEQIHTQMIKIERRLGVVEGARQYAFEKGQLLAWCRDVHAQNLAHPGKPPSALWNISLRHWVLVTCSAVFQPF